MTVSVHVEQMLHIITHEMLFYSLTKLEGIVLTFSIRQSVCPYQPMKHKGLYIRVLVALMYLDGIYSVRLRLSMFYAAKKNCVAKVYNIKRWGLATQTSIHEDVPVPVQIEPRDRIHNFSSQYPLVRFNAYLA